MSFECIIAPEFTSQHIAPDRRLIFIDNFPNIECLCSPYRFRNNQEFKPSRDFKITTEGGKSSLFITELFPDDAGTYNVKATNKAGQASTTAPLKVICEFNI